MPKTASCACEKPIHFTHLLWGSLLAMKQEHGGWQRQYSMALHHKENGVPLLQLPKCKWRKILRKRSKWGQKNRNRRANMAASWRQKNMRSRWRIRQYKETPWERWGWHPCHKPMNWHNFIRASDNRHAQGRSQTVLALRSVEWTYEREQILLKCVLQESWKILFQSLYLKYFTFHLPFLVILKFTSNF